MSPPPPPRPAAPALVDDLAALHKSTHEAVTTLKKQKKYDAAVAQLEPLLAREQAAPDWGLGRAETLSTMATLAFFLSNIPDRQSLGVDLYRRCREAKAEALGAEHPDTLRACNELALACEAAKMFSEALAVSTPLLKSAKEVLGPSHRDTLLYTNTHALVLSRQDDTKSRTDALHLLQDVLKLCRADTELAPRDKQRAVVLAQAEVAGCYERLKQHGKAQSEFAAAAKAAEKVFGPKDDDAIKFGKKAEENRNLA